jgi:cytochrome c oxidase subunit 3
MATPPAALHKPWREPERQHDAMVFGLWVFLASEVLFFGGILLTYAVARHADPLGFAMGARTSDLFYGTLNTAVLMTSSLTMAIGERALKEGLVRWARWALAATVLLGLAFLAFKGLEYRDDFKKHLVPGWDFAFHGHAAQLFWGFYWTVTVVHAIHLTIGIGAVARLLLLDWRDEMPARWMGAETTALYWHLVDIVWILLYPLIYLVGRP